MQGSARNGAAPSRRHPADQTPAFGPAYPEPVSELDLDQTRGPRRPRCVRSALGESGSRTSRLDSGSAPAPKAPLTRPAPSPLTRRSPTTNRTESGRKGVRISYPSLGSTADALPPRKEEAR
jgi:hypothetical protein